MDLLGVYQYMLKQNPDVDPGMLLRLLQQRLTQGSQSDSVGRSAVPWQQNHGLGRWKDNISDMMGRSQMQPSYSFMDAAPRTTMPWTLDQMPTQAGQEHLLQQPPKQM